MSKLLKFSLLFISLLMMTLALGSCNDSETDEVMPADTIFDIATFVEQGSSGAVFSLQRSQFSPELTLTAVGQSINTGLFKVGDRVLIAYTPASGNPDVSGNINLYAMGLVTNGAVQIKTAAESDNFTSQPVRLASVWLTGKYLNFNVKVDCTLQPKTFTIYADESTMDSDCPELYLIFETDDAGSAYWQERYASFDISDVLLSGAEQFKLTVRDANTITGYVTTTFSLTQN